MTEIRAFPLTEKTKIRLFPLRESYLRRSKSRNFQVFFSSMAQRRLNHPFLSLPPNHGHSILVQIPGRNYVLGPLVNDRFSRYRFLVREEPNVDPCVYVFSVLFCKADFRNDEWLEVRIDLPGNFIVNAGQRLQGPDGTYTSFQALPASDPTPPISSAPPSSPGLHPLLWHLSKLKIF